VDATGDVLGRLAMGAHQLTGGFIVVTGTSSGFGRSAAPRSMCSRDVGVNSPAPVLR